MESFTEEQIDCMRKEIIDNLTATGREGIDGLIAWMDENGFFRCPASTQYHLCFEGGLAKHSLNVVHTLIDISRALCLTKDAPDIYSLILVGLLHDLGKCGRDKKPLYVENYLKSGKRSDSKPYETNSDLLYIPHEVRSIVIAEKYIELTEEEEHAILYHNGLYSGLGYEWKGKEKKLDLLLHWADMWASRVLEVEEGGNADE